MPPRGYGPVIATENLSSAFESIFTRPCIWQRYLNRLKTLLIYQVSQRRRCETIDLRVSSPKFCWYSKNIRLSRESVWYTWNKECCLCSLIYANTYIVILRRTCVINLRVWIAEITKKQAAPKENYFHKRKKIQKHWKFSWLSGYRVSTDTLLYAWINFEIL